MVAYATRSIKLICWMIAMLLFVCWKKIQGRKIILFSLRSSQAGSFLSLSKRIKKLLLVLLNSQGNRCDWQIAFNVRLYACDKSQWGVKNPKRINAHRSLLYKSNVVISTYNFIHIETYLFQERPKYLSSKEYFLSESLKL